MLRSERRKHESTLRKIQHLKTILFPSNNLQERVENLGLFYARWGAGFIDEIYSNSNALEQNFEILEINK